MTKDQKECIGKGIGLEEYSPNRRYYMHPDGVVDTMDSSFSKAKETSPKYGHV